MAWARHRPSAVTLIWRARRIPKVCRIRSAAAPQDLRLCREFGLTICLGADELGKIHEFVRAELVIVLPTPGGIHANGTLVARTDAVAPIVLICKTAAGPTNHRHLDRLQSFDNVLAITLDIGNGGMFAHPDTAVDATPQLLGKLAVDLPMDDRPGPILMHGNLRFRGGIRVAVT